jgi:2-keto-4-pentenoate hydratase/2-oxohepta-3-ene-1,7-dioic acid hydratase in catechol pathway
VRLATYRHTVEDSSRLGAIIGDTVVDLKRFGVAMGVAIPKRMLEFIDLGPSAVATIGNLLAKCGDSFPLASTIPLANVRLMAPIPRPRKNIFGIGLNYLDHVAEAAQALETSPELPRQPVIFSKPPTAVIGDGDPVLHNGAITQQLDWEVELGVIIGTTAKRVSRKNALSHVFGYTVLVDMSARDCRRAGQWIYSKGQDSYAPMGPVIVTADEIGDPQRLDLWLTVNGVEKQRSNTSHMLFKVDELISDISQGITLEPGDIIASGTPEGVGAGRTPQEWLWPGDAIEAHVAGIGNLRNPVVNVAGGMSLSPGSRSRSA